MLVKLCHHLKEDGIICQCPALRGRIYCYAHFRAHQRMGVRVKYQRRRRHEAR